MDLKSGHQKNQAERLMEDKKFREARSAAAAMLEILPDTPAAKQLVQEINRKHPMIRVGLMQRSTELLRASGFKAE